MATQVKPLNEFQQEMLVHAMSVTDAQIKMARDLSIANSFSGNAELFSAILQALASNYATTVAAANSSGS